MAGLTMSPELLTNISEIFGHTSKGFTKSELKKKLTACGITCVDDGARKNGLKYTIGLNKKDWLFNCLKSEWEKTKSAAKIIKLLETSFNPMSFERDIHLTGMRNSVNDVLIYAGAKVNGRGQVVYTTKKETFGSSEKPIKEEELKKSQKTAKAYNYEKLKGLLAELPNIKVAQKRGYAFEKFLTELFSEFDLKPRKPFKITGEQIDGSFDYNGEFYLVEAKWQQKQIPYKDVVVFNKKTTDKSTFTRGVFFSYSGFVENITQQYNNKSASFILITVAEIYRMLELNMPLQDCIYKKVRALAEEGAINKDVLN